MESWRLFESDIKQSKKYGEGRVELILKKENAPNLTAGALRNLDPNLSLRIVEELRKKNSQNYQKQETLYEENQIEYEHFEIPAYVTQATSSPV